MSTLLDEYKKLEKKAEERLAIIVNIRGIESKYAINLKVLKVNDDLRFDLPNCNTLVEIGDKCIDKYGYQYDLSVLNLAQLCEIVDKI